MRLDGSQPRNHAAYGERVRINHLPGPMPSDAARIVDAPAPADRPASPATVRLLLAGLPVLLGLTACMPPVLLSSVSRDSRTQQLAEMKLLDIDAETAVHAVKLCGTATKADPQSCGPSAPVSLLLRPNGWSMAQLARKAPLNIANIDSDQTSFSLPVLLSSATNFSRPLIGQRNTRDRFIGAFSTQGQSTASWVWLPPDATIPREPTSTDRFRERWFSKVTFPQAELLANAALILQDGDQTWLFVRRDAQCEDNLCVTVDEVLDGDTSALPRALLEQKFSLYFARGPSQSGDTTDTVHFERVLKERGRAGDHRRLLSDTPLPRGEFVFDAATVGYSDFSEDSPAISCEWSAYTASMIVMLSSEKSAKSAPRFNGCKVLAGAAPLALRRANAIGPIARYTSDDPPQSRRTSNYFCSPSPAAGQAISGSGPHGCGFVLKHPSTHAPMPATPYALSLNVTTGGVDKGERFSTFSGVTDGEGRTAFVRSDRPIETALIGLVPRYRSAAELSGPLAEFSGREAIGSKTYDSLEEGVIIWDRRKYRAAGTPYRIRLCTGQVHEARTDENAMTIAYEPREKRACPITLELLSGP